MLARLPHPPPPRPPHPPPPPPRLQVLAKSCKMLPVMVVGTLLGGKAYSAFDYGCAAAVAAGVGLFASASAPKARLALTAPNALLGYTLCLGNLVLDGYTNAAQDAINRAYAAASPLWTMCWMNFWCGLYNAAYLFGLSTAGAELAAFCTAHPAAAADVALFCACGAVGQLFIFFTIRHFGSLSNTVITTTRKARGEKGGVGWQVGRPRLGPHPAPRSCPPPPACAPTPALPPHVLAQFFNILLSVVVVGHPLLPRQWAAVLLVFGGLLASAVAKAPRARGVGGRAKAA